MLAGFERPSKGVITLAGKSGWPQERQEFAAPDRQVQSLDGLEFDKRFVAASLCRADALDRTGADVADCEHTRYRRLQRRQCSALAAPGASDDKACLVDLDAATAQPLGRRIGADEQEDVADRSLDSSPLLQSGQRTFSTPPSGGPSSAMISVWVMSSMFGVAAIRSMRYRDMLSASPRPRTIMRTLAACPDRKTAP